MSHPVNHDATHPVTLPVTLRVTHPVTLPVTLPVTHLIPVDVCPIHLCAVYILLSPKPPWEKIKTREDRENSKNSQISEGNLRKSQQNSGGDERTSKWHNY